MSEITNHKEALQLAGLKKADSNLARCYIALTADLLASQAEKMRWANTASSLQGEINAMVKERERNETELYNKLAASQLECERLRIAASSYLSVAKEHTFGCAPCCSAESRLAKVLSAPSSTDALQGDAGDGRKV